MFELTIKTLLTHIIGDFVLQTDKSVKDLQDKKFHSKYLYLHFAIHFLLLWLFTGLLLPSLILAIVHISIDMLTKFYCNNTKYSIQVFLLDQVLHLLSIAIFIYLIHGYTIPWQEICNTHNYVLLLTLALLTFASSVGIKIIMLQLPLNNEKDLGSENAGKIIGMLERLFIFGFIINDFWEGIGFLLAAKSIFRFGDLKENKEVRLTEYILIGTLLSFGLAIFISKLYLLAKNFY